MAAEKILAAYYGDGGYEKLHLTEEDVQKLTHINWAFAVIKDGKVTGEHLRHIDHLHKFKNMNPKLKTLISIGGWGAGGFSEAASTEEGRARFADTAIEVMKEFDFDGIDIDWEYPGIPAAGIAASLDDRHNFTLLLKAVRERLDSFSKAEGRQYLLTIAVGAYRSCAENMEVEVIANKYLDFVNLMTYDMGTGSKYTHHHTNLYTPKKYPQLNSVEKAVEVYREAGVPAHKLVIGGAFYGRMWSGVKNERNGLYQPAESRGDKTCDYTILLNEYIDKNGYRRYWDDECKAPYLFDGSIFVTYDDEESVAWKARYVKEAGLAGMMFWEYPLDSSRKLLDAMYREFQKRRPQLRTGG